jgi:hypothetical protein
VVRGQQLKGVLHVLMLPDFARGRPDPRVLGYPESRAFAESPDGLRGGQDARAVLVGMLLEMER